MKEALKLGATLAVFSLLSCVALAFVSQATTPIIDEAKNGESVAAMKAVFPDADKFEEDAAFVSSQKTATRLEKIFSAQQGGKIAGVAMQISGATYDSATLIVGVDASGEVVGTSFLALSDTPGFGQKARDDGYMDQYKGKKSGDAFSVGDDVQAVSGATITSRGLAAMMKDAVGIAAEFLEAHK